MFDGKACPPICITPLEPSSFGWITNNNCATVPRIMDQELNPEILSPPTRSSNIDFRTLLGITVLVGGCTLSAISLLFAAELFPFAPPPSQQRSIEQQPPPGRSQLSQDDLDRISRIASQAKQLSPTDRNQLKISIQKSLNEAAAKGNVNQAQYFGELLRQID